MAKADSKDVEEVEIVEDEDLVKDETEDVEEETVEEEDSEESEDDSDEESDDDSDDGEEDDEEEQSDDDDDGVPFQKRFSQFKGQTPEEYLKELEDAYANSQAEYERLRLGKQDDSDDSDDSDDGADATPPADSYGYDLWAQQTEREYKEFSEEHDLFRTDENVRKEVIEEYLPVVAAVFKKKHGYNISMKDGLKQAYKAAGYADQEEGDTNVTIKKSASTKRANSKRPKKTEAPKVSKKQLETARKMDPSLQGKSDAEVAKSIAKYI